MHLCRVSQSSCWSLKIEVSIFFIYFFFFCFLFPSVSHLSGSSSLLLCLCLLCRQKRKRAKKDNEMRTKMTDCEQEKSSNKSKHLSMCGVHTFSLPHHSTRCTCLHMHVSLMFDLTLKSAYIEMSVADRNVDASDDGILVISPFLLYRLRFRWRQKEMNK